MTAAAPGGGVRLRPFAEADLALLTRFATDPEFSLPFEWSGYRSPATLRKRLEDDGFLERDPHFLAVADAEDRGVGWVMWRDPNIFGRPGWAWEVGIILAPEHRGRGLGTEAQRLLVEHLLATTPVHRLCAYTATENVAEQRALERCGFRREGVLRQAGFRDGAWRDTVAYALLRSDVAGSP